MIKKEKLETVINQCLKLLPPSLQQANTEIKKYLKVSLQNALAQLELVTREEFDVQTAVLKRTREKLEALEELMEKLESEAENK